MPKFVKLLTMVALTGSIAAAGALELFSPGLRSPLEPATPPAPPADYFTLPPPPQAAGWELLLAALLTGGVIARRRLQAN
ncbi:MAG: hypothetical protein H6R24_1906 [Proteobacteria bacterium]|nr:hypothetical protein [Pseudomonadota bacterium]